MAMMAGGHAVGTMLPGRKQSTSADGDGRSEEARRRLAAVTTKKLTDVQRRNSVGDKGCRRLGVATKKLARADERRQSSRTTGTGDEEARGCPVVQWRGDETRLLKNRIPSTKTTFTFTLILWKVLACKLIWKYMQANHAGIEKGKHGS
uniref:Uncharacterized protein n=1 Tax=Oryza punctata TaxID=4537 RepID=A0A0E0LUE1_ORYPU